MGIKQLPKPQTGIEAVDRVLTEHVDKLNPILRALPPSTNGQLVQMTWIPITFKNGWANFGGGPGSGFMPAAYMMDTQGFVHLRGLIQNAAGQAANIAAFTLPVGFRPAGQQCFFGTNNGPGVGVRMDMLANGDFWPSVNVTVLANDFRSLSGITFDTRI